MAWVYIYEINSHTPLQPRCPKVITQLKMILSQAKGRGPESVEKSSHFSRTNLDCCDRLSVIEIATYLYVGITKLREAVSV